jgi:hypothetical protein
MKTAQLTLKEAIKQTVKFFTDNGGEFSKFTITSIIRGDVNNLKYELSDVAGTNLWHHEVRETFEQLLNDSELQIRFNRDHYDETHKTTYQVYVGADIPVITAVQKPGHPHGCGESTGSCSIDERMDGSSPRVWGKPSKVASNRKESRVIPTGVGKASTPLNGLRVNSGHPHGCGESKKSWKTTTLGIGSSPRVWGKQPPPLHLRTR